MAQNFLCVVLCFLCDALCDCSGWLACGVAWREVLGGRCLEGAVWREVLGGSFLEGAFSKKLVLLKLGSTNLEWAPTQLKLGYCCSILTSCILCHFTWKLGYCCSILTSFILRHFTWKLGYWYNIFVSFILQTFLELIRSCGVDYLNPIFNLSLVLQFGASVCSIIVVWCL
jgi:hypothetical protein